MTKRLCDKRLRGNFATRYFGMALRGLAQLPTASKANTLISTFTNSSGLRQSCSLPHKFKMHINLRIAGIV